MACNLQVDVLKHGKVYIYLFWHDPRGPLLKYLTE